METNTRESLYQRAMVVRAKKRLGQNFLVEPKILQLVCDTTNAKPGDTVVEIGPGLGFLTECLVKTGARVYAIELDQDMADRLESLAQEYPNLTVVRRDFLHFDLDELKADKIKVVGNVPYQITTPIISRVLGEIDAPSSWLSRIESLTMTVQYELARRISAQPGGKEYGQITILADYYAEASFIAKVGSEHFVPRPNVESAIIKLVKRDKPKVQVRNAKALRQLVANGFKERRKMLRNNLSFTHLSQEEIQSILLSLGISPAARAETIGLEKLAKLADIIDEHLNN